MKFVLGPILTLLCFPSLLGFAQPPARTARTAGSSAVSTALPPFSGSWVLDPTRSVIAEPISGRSTAVIAYDGITWRYTHRHQSGPESQPEAWQITLTVGSPGFQTQAGEEITFRSRIQRRGNGLVLEQYGVTPRGQKIHNTTRYTLSDDGNTLTEVETSVGPLGPVKNTYVLVRDTNLGAGQTPE
jgi:hypothetical protein